MRLARKLALAFLIGIMLVLAVNAYFRVLTDTRVFEDDMRRDHGLIARALMPAFRRVWIEDGQTRALELLEEANRGITRAEIHWVARDRLSAPAAHDLQTYSTHVAIEREEEDGVLVTYVADERLGGAMEISESLADEESYVRTAIVRASLTALAIVLICAALAWFLGLTFVARPVGKMIEKARRIGSGDFGTPLELRTDDELAELAREMNAMCDQLARETEHRRNAQDQLRHAERLTTVGKLASGIAHELGTPLNIVGARAKMLIARRIEDIAIDENARIIVEQCDRMVHIIRQLLDFARSNVSARKTRVELGLLVQDTAELLHAIALKRGVEIASRVGASVTVLGDRTQLQQVLSNLIMNAVQAMPEGGEVNVSVGTGSPVEPRDVSTHACVIVRDRGPGIPADVLPHIFEPFFTTKPTGEGTGLGLSVVHGIIQEHRGVIEVDTRAGEGACFSVYLPLEVSA
jgi:two-component system, NtrC family, sensor kinase